MPQTHRRTNTGFTIIELLIVVAVIGILAAMSIPNLLTALDKAKQVATAGLLKSFGESMEIYRVDNGDNPVASGISELTVLLTPYSESLRSTDNWHHEIAYAYDDTSYSLESYGKDGIDGPNVTPATRYIFTLDIVFSDGGFSAAIE